MWILKASLMSSFSSCHEHIHVQSNLDIKTIYGSSKSGLYSKVVFISRGQNQTMLKFQIIDEYSWFNSPGLIARWSPDQDGL